MSDRIIHLARIFAVPIGAPATTSARPRIWHGGWMSTARGVGHA